MTKDVSEFYDVFAEEYAQLFFDELDKKPFDRSILLRFAEMTKDLGTVCDIGCGTGHIGSFLKQNGVEIAGIDISGQMVNEAKRLSPHIHFEQGDMFSLRFGDGYFAGIVAFYSIVHLSLTEVDLAFLEFKRLIHSGGYLLISFHLGDETIKVDKCKDDKIASAVYVLFDPDEIINKIKKVGFLIEEAIIRYPYEDAEYPSKRAYILARKLQ
ncbi:MAG TPA: methyltransferase domain-containing protein [Syntrophomonadaceae bacterium]|nr:methyltransferase domain-containing protein [Syntrophomonadaceae bacterium]